MRETELIQKFKTWIHSYFQESELVFDEEVKLFLGNEPQKFRTDLVVIQSKSNVLHSFELKNRLANISFNSVLWQADSLYGNYKWLVFGDLIDLNPEQRNQVKEKGIGIIHFDQSQEKFSIKIKAKYIDGNFLDFYPTLKEKWNNKLEYGSNSRSKKKN